MQSKYYVEGYDKATGLQGFICFHKTESFDSYDSAKVFAHLRSLNGSVQHVCKSNDEAPLHTYINGEEK
jgi:hypothetical protein